MARIRDRRLVALAGEGVIPAFLVGTYTKEGSGYLCMRMQY